MDLPGPSTLLAVVAALVLAGWYLSFSAGRLDRLHSRVEGARAALDAQLVRRASVSLQLATSGLLDPASGLLLAGAAHDAREAPEEAREQAESDLTRALHAAFDDPDLADELRRDRLGEPMAAELAAACQRVELSRRFHNEAVRGARVVRRKKVVRYVRLAGHAPWPETFEMDDTAPPVLLAVAGAPPPTVGG
jgi:uncharacterized protein (DUF1800 family)